MELLFPSRRKTPRVSVSEAEYAPAKIFSVLEYCKEITDTKNVLNTCNLSDIWHIVTCTATLHDKNIVSAFLKNRKLLNDWNFPTVLI